MSHRYPVRIYLVRTYPAQIYPVWIYPDWINPVRIYPDRIYQVWLYPAGYIRSGYIRSKYIPSGKIRSGYPVQIYPVWSGPVPIPVLAQSGPVILTLTFVQNPGQQENYFFYRCPQLLLKTFLAITLFRICVPSRSIYHISRRLIKMAALHHINESTVIRS